MRQAFHILRKDVRYLWREIAALTGLAVANALAVWRYDYSPRPFVGTDLALVVGALLIIVRLIHAESIAGDRQFWVTRPYRWKSLLVAKVAFLILFFNLPILLVRLAFLTRMGFPLRASLPPLLWSQLTLLVCAALPAAALAAMTSRLVSFVLSAFGFLVFLLPTVLPVVAPGIITGPDWMPGVSLGVVWAGAAFVVLVFQYKSRLAKASRLLAIGAIGAIVAWAGRLGPLPPALGFALQAALPIGNSAEAARLAAVDLHFSKLYYDQSSANRWKVEIGVQGPGKPEDKVIDGFRIALKADDGRSWNSGWVFHPRVGNLRDVVDIDPAFLASERKSLLMLRASVYVTLVGDAQPPFELPVLASNDTDEKRYPSTAFPGVYAGSSVQCAAISSGVADVDWTGHPGRRTSIQCRAPLSWPVVKLFGDRISKTGETRLGVFGIDMGRQDQDTPFPAGAWGLNLTEAGSSFGFGSWDAVLDPADTHLIHVWKPIAHFRRDIEQRIRLDDPAPR